MEERVTDCILDWDYFFCILSNNNNKKKEKKSDYKDLDNWTYLKRSNKIKRNIDLLKIKIKNKIKINLK